MSKPLSHTLKGVAPCFDRVYKFDIDFTVANGSSNPGIGTGVIGSLPVGKFAVVASHMKGLVFSTSDTDATTTWDGDWAVGTAPNADANLTTAADYSLNGPSGGTAIGAATARVSPTQDVASWKGAIVDNSAGDLEVNLNVMVDDASQSGDIAMNAVGEFHLVFMKIG